MSSAIKNKRKINIDRQLQIQGLKKVCKFAACFLTVLTVIALLFAANVFGIADRAAASIYHEKVLSLTPDGNMPQLIDWRLEPDGSITALSNDPMLAFYTKDAKLDLSKIKSVDIDIENRSNTQEEYLQFYFMPNYETKQYPIHSGQNHIVLPRCKDGDIGFRLDIANIEKTNMKINSLVLNSSRYYGKEVAQNAALFFIPLFLACFVLWALHFWEKAGGKRAAAAIACGLWLTFLSIFILDPAGSLTKHVADNYKEYTYTKDDLGNKLSLVDYKKESDGSITSNAFDPMVVVYFRKDIDGEKLKLITVNIKRSDLPDGQSGLMYYLPDYSSTPIASSVGKNVYYLVNYDEEDATGIRLDFTSDINQNTLIDSIVLNDNDYIINDIKSHVLPIFLWSIAFAVFAFFMQCKCKTGVYFDKWRIISYTAAFASGCFASAAAADGAALAFTGILVLALLLVLAHCKRAEMLIFALVYTYFNYYVLATLTGEPAEYLMHTVFFGGSYLFELLAILLVSGTIIYLIGPHLGGLLFGLFCAADIFGNSVKMKYHNDALIPADLGILDEFFGIAGDYIPLYAKIIITLVLLTLLVLTIVFRKKIGAFFKPVWRPVSLVYVLVLLAFYFMAAGNAFSFAGIRADKLTEIKSKEALEHDGLALYTMLAFTRSNSTSAPDGYSQNLPETVQKSTKNSVLPETDVKPNVILILGESLFEVEKTPGISYNKPLLSNLSQYKVTNGVAPYYGGRTAAAEWETLTGLSNYFLPEGQIAYTSYLGQSDKPTGSIAREFAENGYGTYAVHANTGSFYSRDKVYKNMGIEKFISLEDFVLPENARLGDGRVRDEIFADKIIELLESEDKPAFIFGASLESHYPYSNKYAETDVKASAEGADESQLIELSGYGQSIYNFDEQMGRLIDYCENCGEPCLIYIFGDHLPTLSYNTGKAYLEDKYYKYRTPLFAYSNYCDTSIEAENVSLNRVAAEIIEKSGIKHRRYFDFIAECTKEYPVIQREFTQSREGEKLNIYDQITWDLTRGKRYLLE